MAQRHVKGDGPPMFDFETFPTFQSFARSLHAFRSADRLSLHHCLGAGHSWRWVRARRVSTGGCAHDKRVRCSSQGPRQLLVLLSAPFVSRSLCSALARVGCSVTLAHRRLLPKASLRISAELKRLSCVKPFSNRSVPRVSLLTCGLRQAPRSCPTTLPTKIQPLR